MSARWLALGLVLLAGRLPALPEIQHWETDRGARVYFMAASQLPIVDVRVVFDAGSARDGSLPGLAKLTNALLEEGAGELDADEIADRFADLAVEFTTNSRRDMAIVRLRSLSSPRILHPAVDLMALIMAHPTFTEDSLGRVRQQLLVALKHQGQKPSKLAERAFYGALFNEHPYATPVDGNLASVTRIRRSDVQEFHARHYLARNAMVAIVGDLKREDAVRLADKLTADLPAGEPHDPLPPTVPVEEAFLRRIPFPSDQTHLLVGQVGLSRLDSDFFPLYVGNHLLGGSGLVSLLAEEIREQRGLVYSVYSYFVPMAQRGPFILGLQTRNEKAQEALRLLHGVLARFVSEGPDPQRLDAAKQNLVSGFPLRIAGNRKLIGYLSMIGFYRLPLDYLQRFTERVEAVTAADVRAAFAARVRPDRLVTVAVGPGEVSTVDGKPGGEPGHASQR